jgi:hypothetical protein
MKKNSRLPHEQVIGEQNDGLGAEHDARPDVEGHSHLGGEGFGPGAPGTGGDQLSPGMPGTGGDYVRRPVGGGEADDVEGHSMGHTKGERLGPGMPGTGGDVQATDDASDTDPHRILA